MKKSKANRVSRKKSNVKVEKKIRVALVGSTGRMGLEIKALLQSEAKTFTYVAGISTRATGVDPRHHKKIAELNPDSVDVVVDFSLPQLTKDVAAWAKENKICLVSGVTGLSEKEMGFLAAAAKLTPVLWAPNMSLGVAVMGRMLQQLSVLDRAADFDFQIEELHHRHKKDRPSGTALRLQSQLQTAMGDSKEIPDPLAIRGGGIFGVHRVWAMGSEETITIEHQALSRAVFARGAIRAAQWLADRRKSPGLYSIDDVLGI